MPDFRFKRFTVMNDASAMKVGTDGVLLGAAMTLPGRTRGADPLHLLDIGTGTGCVALMAAQRLSDSLLPFFIEAIDIDAPSAAEASANFASSPWAAKLTSRNVSLCEYGSPVLFDAIFSNPPFFEDSLRNRDGRRAVARHTGELSYREIFAFAAQHMAEPESTVSLILPSQQETGLLRCAASFGFYPFRLVRIRTTEHKPCRRLLAEFSSLRTGSVAEEELVLQDGNLRSPAFQSLVEDFLLRQKDYRPETISR